jgi:VWFA-related protein
MITKIFRVSEKIEVQRFLNICIVLISLAPGILAQITQPTPQPEEVVKISTNLIQLDVSVTDKNGKSINDLTPDEIEVFENGEKQKLSNFSFISAGHSQTGDTAAKSSAGQVNVPKPPPGPVQPGQIRRTIALVVDDLTLSYESANLVRKSLKKFVDTQMQDGDLVTVIRTGAGSGVLQQFTSDKRLLSAAIENVRYNPLGRGRLSAFEQKTDVPGSLKDPKYGGDDSPEEEQFKSAFNDFRESVFGTGTLSTLKFMVSAMRELPGRKSVILFSDGFSIFQRDEHGYTEGGKVVEVLRLLVEAANRSSVVFYTVDARTLQNTDISVADSVSLPTIMGRAPRTMGKVATERTKELFDTQGGLDFLAKETGGFPIKNQNNLNEGLERVLYDQSYYLVGYQPDTDTFDAKSRRFNKIEIKVKREGATVRYRSGFFAVTDTELIKPKTAASAQAQQLENLITSPFASTNISLRLNTVFGNNSSGSYVTPLLNINARDLKFTDSPDGTKRVDLEVLAISFGSDGVPVDKLRQNVTVNLKPEIHEKILKTGFLYHFSFPIKNPGGYQFRVAVRDKQAETVGVASQFIEVPDLKKNRLTLSGILLENFTSEQWGRFSGEVRKAANTRNVAPNDQTDPMNDTSVRRFAGNTVLRYGFEIYNGGLDGVKNTALFTKIRVFRDGQPVLDGPEIPVETAGQGDLKRIQAGGAMNLPRDMPAGDYILQLIVTDGTGKNVRQSATQFVEFEIVN